MESEDSIVMIFGSISIVMIILAVILALGKKYSDEDKLKR